MPVSVWALGAFVCDFFFFFKQFPRDFATQTMKFRIIWALRVHTDVTRAYSGFSTTSSAVAVVVSGSIVEKKM